MEAEEKVSGKYCDNVVFSGTIVKVTECPRS